ncbi:hypothetical protein Mgra_00008727 [Meloidogyne graminicola]|uniref:Uncharacterized protein n=1 Tax=Meloidogyne graminicola TaxID=189291 RepID=A0A8S9ZF08_9BILA|nr:hypothetical protein Mgra_00008727 [Meloidogyne graminicola]
MPKKSADPDMPKRNLSAYFLWMKENREHIKQPGMSAVEVAKAGGVEWGKLSASDKSVWEKKKAIAEPAKDFRIKDQHGLCSMFLINVEKGKKAYRYDVDVLNITKQKNLSKGADDGQRALHRNICYELLTVAYGKTRAFGMPAGSEIVYNCKSLMYTSAPINLDEPKIMIHNDEVNDYVRTYMGASDFSVSVLPNLQVPVLDISDLEQYKTRKAMFYEDRTLRTFLEMALTQFSINKQTFLSNQYAPVGVGKLYEITPENQVSVGNGIVMRSGVAKGVRIVHNYGDPSPALVLDTKVSPFYESQDLIATIMAITNGRQPQMNDWPRIRAILGDVRVEPNTPVPKGRAIELFPIEQLIIMEDQRLPMEKLDKNLSAKLLTANSILPQERFDKIMRHANEMGVFDQTNAVLRAFGISVAIDSNKIVIGVRSSPRIRYANNQIVTPTPDQADWRKASGQHQYFETHEICNWIVLCDGRNQHLVSKFVDNLVAAARKKGMILSNRPPIMPFSPTSRGWPDLFERCVNRNIEFIMLIDNKTEDTHGLLKYYEAYYKVVTQHITLERAKDVVTHGKAQTLENIIHKVNCKNFGLNYVPLFERSAERFSFDKGKILVVGYDVSHPPAATHQERRMMQVKGLTCESFDPSVVGICANMAKNPHNFVGDYFYQESRRESVDIVQLSERVTWILTLLEKNRPEHAKPKYIMVLRDGISEGQYKMAVEEEMEAFKIGCLHYNEDYKPKFMFVVGTKRHFKKFFMVHDDQIVNLTPGSVINEKVVRPDLPEFFMQSHYPIKGTGKPVEYSVLIDELGMTQDELQGFLNGLCYSHQIVNMAISLPEPIYQADELAKRGRNNFMAMKRFFPDMIPRQRSGLVLMKELTDLISYKDSILSNTRFTA